MGYTNGTCIREGEVGEGSVRRAESVVGVPEGDVGVDGGAPRGERYAMVSSIVNTIIVFVTVINDTSYNIFLSVTHLNS